MSSESQSVFGKGVWLKEITRHEASIGYEVGLLKPSHVNQVDDDGQAGEKISTRRGSGVRLLSNSKGAAQQLMRDVGTHSNQVFVYASSSKLNPRSSDSDSPARASSRISPPLELAW